MNEFIKNHPYISGILIPPLLYFFVLGLVVLCLVIEAFVISPILLPLAVFLPVVALVLISLFNIYVIFIAKGYRKILIIFFVASLIFLFCLYFFVYIYAPLTTIQNMQIQGD
ncbi:hypothetical protein OAJ23_05060 [Pelagibacteraceae bacterium]|nr:hypothetical protein [Pelagibacteraceae bacterium]